MLTLKFDGKPVEVLIDGLEKDATVTQGDILFALNRQKTRILSRTAKGVDINGKPFNPYKESPAYYWYPGHRAAAFKSRRASALRQAKKTGGKVARVGVRFPGYGSFKRSLGRVVVDLMGPSAPHMVQAVVVKCLGITLFSGDAPNILPTTNIKPASEGVIGIYGNEAERADGHNNGNPKTKLPKREWFGFGPGDDAVISEDLLTRMTLRMKRRIS
jgi:hypothetical protein